jgi:hypothetical protein
MFDVECSTFFFRFKGSKCEVCIRRMLSLNATPEEKEPSAEAAVGQKSSHARQALGEAVFAPRREADICR